MSSLADIRRWLQGENVEGLPPRSLAWDPKLEKKIKVLVADDVDGEIKTGDTLTDRYRKKRERMKAGTDVVVGSKSKGIGKYRISGDGDDAVLKFGKHKGKQISELIKTNPGYLDWMSRQDFPDELKDVIRHQQSLLTTRLADEEGVMFEGMDGMLDDPYDDIDF